MASFFLSGYSFLDLDFRADVEIAMVVPLLVVLAALLARASYTDLLCGRLIRNSVSLALAVTALAVVPLLFADPLHHLLWALPALGVIAIGFFVGAFAAGDVKLWVGMSILLGPAAVFFLFFSWLAIVLYSIPHAIQTRRRLRASGVKVERGMRLGAAPGAPGIALALPLLMLSYGAEPLQAAAVVAAMGLFFGLYVLDARLNEKIAEKEGFAQPKKLAEEFNERYELGLEPDSQAFRRLAVALGEAHADAEDSANEPKIA